MFEYFEFAPIFINGDIAEQVIVFQVLHQLLVALIAKEPLSVVQDLRVLKV